MLRYIFNFQFAQVLKKKKKIHWFENQIQISTYTDTQRAPNVQAVQGMVSSRWYCQRVAHW